MTQTYPRKRRIWPWIAIPAALALFFFGVGILVGKTTTDEPAPTASHTATAKPTTRGATQPTTPAKAAEVAVGAGTWSVPGEVKPGTYVTTADGHCYWARLRNFDGELESILANDNLAVGQRGRLTVKKADKGLELSGDCIWTAAK